MAIFLSEKGKISKESKDSSSLLLCSSNRASRCLELFPHHHASHSCNNEGNVVLVKKKAKEGDRCLLFLSSFNHHEFVPRDKFVE